MSINYNIRTAKSVERRMLLYSLQKLFKDSNRRKCRYIGFGATYFTDFKLFHKELFIDKMISFERDLRLKKRIEFNKPLKCIDVKFGSSTPLLRNEVDWDSDYYDFIWMDYTDTLDYDMFNDVDIIFRKIRPGSIYLTSLNKQLRYNNIEDFNEEFGPLVPIGTGMFNLNGENDFRLIRQMFLAKINDTVISRNHSLPVEEKLVFRQLFFITYRDGAPMVSFGGLLDKANSNFNLNKYDLHQFDFIKMGDDRFNIDPPSLTHKEILFLNSFLPNNESYFLKRKSLEFIPISERKNYKKLYKFLPNYMDVYF